MLDLFGGTGQLGIECLSRGAESATFADARGDATRLIRENLEHTGLADRAAVLTADYATVLSAGRKSTIWFFWIRPIRRNFWNGRWNMISQFDILREHGIIVCESPLDKILPELSAPYGKHREYRYGKIKVTIYHRD